MKTFIKLFFITLIVFTCFGQSVFASTCGTDVSGRIYQDTIWSKANSPYCLTGNVVVYGTLTIEPGVVVNFWKSEDDSQDNKYSLIINGQLIARGTASENILFTSSSSSPEPGDWGYIELTEDATAAIFDENGEYLEGSIFEYITVEYGGGGDKSTINALKSPYLNHVVIQKNNKSVYLETIAKIANSSFTNNTNEFSLDIITGYHSYGSVVYAKDSLTISNSTFTSNISNYSTVTANGSLTVADSSFVNNTGGAISGSGTITNCTFTDNTEGAINSGNSSISKCIFINNSSYNGGAINGANNTISNCTFTNNSASYGGGAIYSNRYTTTISNCTFTNNSASNKGGAVNGAGTISNSVFIGNSADTGIIYINGELTLTDCLVYNSQSNDEIKTKYAVWLNSGEITRCTISDNPGGIYIASSSLTISGSNIFGNRKSAYASSPYENVYDVYNNSTKDIQATGNYWGTDNPATIDFNIFDKVDDTSKGEVVFWGSDVSYLTDYAPDAPLIQGSMVTVSPKSYNFGVVDTGYTALQTLSVNNIGSESIGIGTASLTGANSSEFMIQNNACSGTNLATSDSCTVEIVFSPTSAGSKSATLNIPFNDSDTPTANVTLSGTGHSATVENGFLKVTIIPQEAVTAGAQWSVNDTWYNSNETAELPEGTYTIEFKNLTGYTTPESQTVTVTNGQTLTITGTYTYTPVNQQGYLQVTINPQEAADAGAKWKVNDTWNDSNDSVQLTPGTYTVEFNTISGWNTPDSQTVTITTDQTTATSGTYTQTPSLQGSLAVGISPQDAINAGAQWRVDNGTWQDSDYTELSAGTHTIEFKTISGWNRPSNQTVTINDSQTTEITGTYDEIPIDSGAFLTMDDFTAAPGDKDVPLIISLDNSTNNTTPVSSMQIRIRYDAATGIHPKKPADLTSRTQGFSTSVTVTQDGANSQVLILLYDMSNEATISSGTGPILELLFDISSDAEPNDSTVLEFTECLLSDASADQIPSECSDTATITIGDSCEPQGDINNDDDIDILDLQSLANCILGSGNCECSDLNSDSSYNILDIQMLINKIINPSGRRYASKARSRQGSDSSNTLVFQDVEFQENETGSFGLELTNAGTVASGQIRFIYDSTTGFRITGVSRTSRTDSFDDLVFQTGDDPTNTEVLVMFYSMSGTELSPGSGDILEFTYETANYASGTMTFAFTEALLADQSASPLQLSVQPPNELTEAIRILKLLSGINTGGFYTDADVNGDRKTGMQEVIYRLQVISEIRQ
ncbi:MAG: choice-of-anchor D domain-containing protein [Desulfobacterales bacterium]|nr:choice-of-anchor D domain-containing protein [Desulfobacterales bacterium]